jgi:hypothetical protein
MFLNSEAGARFVLQRLDAGRACLVRSGKALIAVVDGAGEYRIGPSAMPYLEPWFRAHERPDGLWTGMGQTASLHDPPL